MGPVILRRLASVSCAALCVAAAASAPATAKTLRFAGHTWVVRSNGVGSPRNNTWCEDNAFVDVDGHLHLRLTISNGVWCAAEVISADSMGFGTYQWQLGSRVDNLDKNVVVGLFNYPPPSVGPDGTNEIDIEFTRWGVDDANQLNYTIFPAEKGVAETTQNFPLTMSGDFSTHRFIWKKQSIRFQSTNGHYSTNVLPIADWTYSPTNYAQRIGYTPVPVRMNIWKTDVPTNGQATEVVISSFEFTPGSP
jgi:hypothetical protein